MSVAATKTALTASEKTGTLFRAAGQQKLVLGLLLVVATLGSTTQ